ncbi:MAG: hypothetical protein ABIP07_00550, partial [Sphingomicrobium sp.]
MTIIAALILAMAVPAATPAPAAPAEHRLSETEIEKVLAEAARKREAQALTASKTGPDIHGEIGVSIGTGGYRSVHGTAVVELPDDGFAS